MSTKLVLYSSLIIRTIQRNSFLFFCQILFISNLGCRNIQSPQDSNATFIPQKIQRLIPIKNWTAFGPFTFDTLTQKPRETIFNNDLLIDGIEEEQITLENLEKIKEKFNTLNVKEKDGYIDLFDYVNGQRRDKSNFYLFTTLNSEIEQTVILTFDFAAGMMLWLNGNKLFEDHHKTGTPRKLEKFLSVKLKKGNNTLLIKINREENVFAWKFVFYISSLQIAKDIYRSNYVEDYINTPNVLSDNLSLYRGPYLLSDIKGFFIASSGSEEFIQHKLYQQDLTSDILTTNISDLDTGFYRCRMLIDKDTMEETIYKGNLFRFQDDLKKQASSLSLDSLIKHELDLNLAKFDGQLWNSGDTSSESNQRERAKKCVFYGYTAYSTVQFLKKGNSTFRHLSGTYSKSYYSKQQHRYNAFLYHVNKELTNTDKKVPLILIIPWTLPAEEFINEGYYDAMPQIEADIMLADEYGFAIAWPFLRGKSHNMHNIIDDIMCVMKKLSEDYNIDQKNIYLMGDSEGAKRVLSIADNSPLKYNGLSLFVPDWTSENSFNITKIKDVPILLARAKEDRYPKEIVTSFVKEVRKSGNPIKFEEYDGGHESFRKDHHRIGFQFFQELVNGN